MLQRGACCYLSPTPVLYVSIFAKVGDYLTFGFSKMNLSLELDSAKNYKSPAQRIRVLTEEWVQQNGYCANCGAVKITRYQNNAPVADFYCENCGEDYELKSKLLSFGNRIVDGAYRTMIERLRSANNPNFLFLNYNKSIGSVVQFLTIPKQFILPGMIEKRNPLASTARRAGWVGCNIHMENIPLAGKIYFVKDGTIQLKPRVLNEWKQTLFLRKQKNVDAKGWLLDVLRCVEQLQKDTFTLRDMYAFENKLQLLHKNNKFVRDKIRQQLQILRDQGLIKFTSRGVYRLVT